MMISTRPVIHEVIWSECRIPPNVSSRWMNSPTKME